MKRTAGLMIAILLWLAPVKALSQLTAPPTRYRVVALGTLGGKSSVGFALNNRGQVVGQSEDKQGKKHAFLWEKGKMRALNLPPAQSSQATDINDTGQAVCVVREPGGKSSHVILWQNGQAQTVYSVREPKRGPFALINNRGTVVVASATATGSETVFLWQQGKRFDIPIDSAYQAIRPYAIADSGKVLCEAYRVDGQGNGLNKPICIIEQGRLRPLGDKEKDDVNINGMNDQGQVVGFGRFAQMTTPRLVPFLWDKGKLTELNTSGYGLLWGPLHINNRGQVVGIGARAVLLYWQAGKLYQLNDFLPLKEGWEVEGERMSINDRGEILVNLKNNEQTRAYLLIPTGS